WSSVVNCPSHQVARSLLSHNLHGLTFAIIIFSVVGLFLSSFDNIDPSTSANSRRTCFDKSFRISSIPYTTRSLYTHFSTERLSHESNIFQRCSSTRKTG